MTLAVDRIDRALAAWEEAVPAHWGKDRALVMAVVANWPAVKAELARREIAALRTRETAMREVVRAAREFLAESRKANSRQGVEHWKKFAAAVAALDEEGT